MGDVSTEHPSVSGSVGLTGTSASALKRIATNLLAAAAAAAAASSTITTTTTMNKEILLTHEFLVEHADVRVILPLLAEVRESRLDEGR